MTDFVSVSCIRIR